jgi:hypothetical protein
MRRPRPSVAPDIAELLTLVRQGRLFAVESWLREGRRVRDPANTHRQFSPLLAALKTGFHSLVELLLRPGGWSQEELDEAVGGAMSAARLDLVDLLLAQGAKVAGIDFADVCRTVDLAVMERYLRAGVDPARDNAFARALHDIKARPLLGFYRQFCEEYPVLHAQASLALSEAVKEGKPRWVALLRWAGADPFLEVPDRLYDANWDFSCRLGFCAADHACWAQTPELLKALKLRPNPAEAQQLLRSAALCASPEIMRAVVRLLPAGSINAGERNACEAVDPLLDDFGRYAAGQRDERMGRVAACLEILLDAGARWSPEPRRLGSIRRRLVSQPSRHLVRLIRLLLYTPGAADRAQVLEVCRTPVIRQKLADGDRALAKEMEEMRFSGAGA